MPCAGVTARNGVTRVHGHQEWWHFVSNSTLMPCAPPLILAGLWAKHQRHRRALFGPYRRTDVLCQDGTGHAEWEAVAPVKPSSQPDTELIQCQVGLGHFEVSEHATRQRKFIDFLPLAPIKPPFPGAAAAKQGRELSTPRFRPLNLRVSVRAITLR